MGETGGEDVVGRGLEIDEVMLSRSSVWLVAGTTLDTARLTEEGAGTETGTGAVKELDVGVEGIGAEERAVGVLRIARSMRRRCDGRVGMASSGIACGVQCDEESGWRVRRWRYLSRRKQTGFEGQARKNCAWEGELRSGGEEELVA